METRTSPASGTNASPVDGPDQSDGRARWTTIGSRPCRHAAHSVPVPAPCSVRWTRS